MSGFFSPQRLPKPLASCSQAWKEFVHLRTSKWKPEVCRNTEKQKFSLREVREASWRKRHLSRLAYGLLLWARRVYDPFSNKMQIKHLLPKIYIQANGIIYSSQPTNLTLNLGWTLVLPVHSWWFSVSHLTSLCLCFFITRWNNYAACLRGLLSEFNELSDIADNWTLSIQPGDLIGL